MKYFKILFILTVIVLSSVLLGCIQAPVEPPAPTATPPPATPTPTAATPTALTPTLTPIVTLYPPVTYRIWVDSDYGFYVARALINNSYVPLPPNFNILNFTIKIGDHIRWYNDDSYDFPLTIASKEELWTRPIGYLRYNQTSFAYTFNQSGNYHVYIKDYPRLPQQNITVV